MSVEPASAQEREPPTDGTPSRASAGHDLFDVYAVAIEDTNQLKNYGQRIDSMYVTILTLVLAGDAYVAASSRFDSWIPVAVTAAIAIVGISFCQRWLRGLTNLNEILSHRYRWLRDLEQSAELTHTGANLFTREYEEVYLPSKFDRVARRRNRQIQHTFRWIFIAIPLVLALATLAATNPWWHIYIEPLLPGK